MNTKIKFKELLAMILEKPKGKVPTYKHLTETEEPLHINSDRSVRCYPSGYVAYSSVSGKTVFSVFDCDTYKYESEIGEADVAVFFIPISEYEQFVNCIQTRQKVSCLGCTMQEIRQKGVNPV